MKKHSIIFILLVLFSACSNGKESKINSSDVNSIATLYEDSSGNDEKTFDKSINNNIYFDEEGNNFIDFTPDANINDERVNLRTEPNKASDVVFLLNKGTLIETIGINSSRGKISELNDHWYKIKTEMNQIGWVYGEYITFFEKAFIKQIFEGCIIARDLKIAGMNNIENFYQIEGKLNQGQIDNVRSIGINSSKNLYFFGIEKFDSLRTISCQYCDIYDLQNKNHKNNIDNLILEYCNIENMFSIPEFEKLYYLSLKGSHIVDITDIKFSNSLKIINISEFPQYSDILKILPMSIEQIYLDSNDIHSFSEINFLKEKYPELTRIYMKDTKITNEDFLQDAEDWMPIKLMWYDD
jgi:hypothetical protein